MVYFFKQSVALKISFHHFLVIKMTLNLCFSARTCSLEFRVPFVRIVIKSHFIKAIDGTYRGRSLALSTVRVKFERYIIVYCINIY